MDSKPSNTKHDGTLGRHGYGSGVIPLTPVEGVCGDDDGEGGGPLPAAARVLRAQAPGRTRAGRRSDTTHS